MKWRLRVYNRNGDTIASVDYSKRADAHAHMGELPEFLNGEGDSYWFDAPGTLTLIRYEDFGFADITRIEANDE